MRLVTKEAFTLLETSVVLGLISILLALGWNLNLNFSCKYQEEQFWQAFRQHWSYTILKTRQTHTSSRVSFDEDCVKFKVQMKKIIILKYPKTLGLSGVTRNEDISASGVTQAQTVRLKSTLKPTYYDIKFQVGYGGQYNVEAFN